MSKAIPSTRTSYARGLNRGVEVLKSLASDAERGYCAQMTTNESKALWIVKKALELAEESNLALRGKGQYGGRLERA